MILVTGGAGFIGSNLVAGLEARGLDDIAVCDWLGRGEKWRNIAKRRLAALIAPERLGDFLAAPEAKRLKAIFHMGAVSATTETDADLIAASNFALPQKLWRHCAEHGIRFFYASSAATYGDRESEFRDDAGKAALAALRPLNPYGWSKHAFDRFAAHEAAQIRPCPPQWVGLKFFNVYGPNEYHKGGMRSVAEQLYPAIARGEPARLFKSHRPGIPDGGQKRDFVWVGDCVDVMLWLYDHPAVSGLFNCGSGRARSFAELARAVFAAAGKPEKIDYIDMPEALRGRYQYFTEADMTKLRAAGYAKAFTALEDGVARYVRDFLSQPDPYR